MIVGIDIGTQSLKAVIVTPELEVLAQHAIAYRPSFPRPGWAEQDPAIWENALRPAIQGALSLAKLSSGDVKALGIAGQLDGCVATDASGLALRSCLIWMDRRAEAELSGIDPDLISGRCGVVLDASHLAAKIKWLRQHDPEMSRARRFHGPVSYVVSRLTGEHVIDHATASTSMVYGLHSRGYETELLDLFDIDEAELPQPEHADRAAGQLTATGRDLTGLPIRTPVAVGTGDDFSSVIGAGLSRPGRLLNVLGTAEVVGSLHDRPVVDANKLVETHAFLNGTYFIENPGWLSGGALTWFRDTFGLSGFAELDALAGNVSAGSDGLTFVPALSGAMAPEWIASARGCFYGLTPSHGRGHLARAVLEGTAFAMRDVLDRLVSMGLSLEALRIVGGGARSQLWTQIRSDLTGLPIEKPHHRDTSPLGAAILAGVCAGLIRSVEEAGPYLSRDIAVVDPDSSCRSAYDDAYERYRRLFECLRPLY